MLKVKNDKKINRRVAALCLCCLSLAGLCAAQVPEDSLSSTSLRELVVTAPQSVSSGGSRIYYPKKELTEVMTNSSQLLAGLQIPELIVNPATGSIAISGGGKLVIRINGRPASQTELMAISAKDITKIEYKPTPGVRDGAAAAVLELTVKRKLRGHSLMLNLLQSPNRGWGDYTAAAKYNLGRSEWSVDYHSNPMWRMQCFRNNKEYISLPGGSEIFRREEGIRTPNRMATHRLALQYSYAENSSLLFNVQGRLIRQNDRYASSGTIITECGDISFESPELEAAPFSSWQYDLDLYLHWKISPKHKLYFNLVPSFATSRSERIFEAPQLTISSAIDSRAASVLGEAVWEARTPIGLFTSGMRAEAITDKAVYSTDGSIARDRSVDAHIFGEWSRTLGKFRYMAGLDASLFRLSQPASRSFANLSPRLYLRYAPSPKLGVGLSLDASTVTPSSAQLSPVLQRIDMFQYSVGASGLEPYRKYKAALELDYSIRGIAMKLTLADNYCHRPVMEMKMYDGDKIVRSFRNAGFNNELIVKAQLRAPLPLPGLTLSLEGGWHGMVSEGAGYRHTYAQPFVNAQLIFVKGPWWCMAKYNNACNILWGETVSAVNNNMLNIGAAYCYKALSFMAGIVNPIGRISIRSRDLSAIAGYERTYHAASTSRLAWIGVSFNLQSGARRSATQKKLDNTRTYTPVKNVQK